MAEFIPVGITRRKTKKEAITLSKKVTDAPPTDDTSKEVFLFAKSFEFLKILNAQEIAFLLVVIAKTKYGALKDVPIPRTDIIQNQTIPSLAIKQIREKLTSMGLIEVTQKRIGRGSEAWHYSLCNKKIIAILSSKEC